MTPFNRIMTSDCPILYCYAQQSKLVSPVSKAGMYSIPSHPHKLGYRDSNPNCDSQSVGCCHYTIAHYYCSDPSGNTTRTAMLSLGISKEKKKYEKEKHNYFGWAVYPSSQVLFTECVGNHFRPQNNFHHKLNAHYKRPRPGRLVLI